MDESELERGFVAAFAGGRGRFGGCGTAGLEGGLLRTDAVGGCLDVAADVEVEGTAGGGSSCLKTLGGVGAR